MFKEIKVIDKTFYEGINFTLNMQNNFNFSKSTPSPLHP